MKRDKISPAFEAFLAESGPNDKREAIVIYRTPEAERLGSLPRRVQKLQRRLEHIKKRVAAQQPVQARLLQAYKTESRRHMPRREMLAAEPIGGSVLPVSHVEVTQKTLSTLAKRDDVVAVLPNQRVRLLEPKAVDYEELGRRERNRGMTWGLEQLNIPEMWQTTKGRAVRVAVLDTGVHADHPALQHGGGRVKEFIVIDPLGRRIEASPPFDGGQHGTHVCGTIAGGKTNDNVAIGVAPEADLLAGGVLIGTGTLRGLVDGISWAVENGADIVNMSLGFDYYEPLFDQFLEMLIEQYGVLPVVAIGNENHGNSSSPGNAPSAFSVGAVEKSGRGVEVAFFSSGASLVFPSDPDNPLVTKPDVVAPGAQVYSSIPPEKTPSGTYLYAYFNGTSMATPHTAGVAALLMAAKPNAPVVDIIEALKQTARHPDGAGRRPDNRWGYGLIRPTAALEAL